ncbi:hypothetical protein HID58_028184 [Brassica napus]|uniref:Expansin n=1 Tax=Brassica napus TaxID=3708 RepID=A0ABQ8CU09_BRANA|nr:hypothetical protein HID58_028184 [Brassica napus]
MCCVLSKNDEHLLFFDPCQLPPRDVMPNMISSVSAGWMQAHATFYGGSDASGGACGYGDLYNDGYKNNTAALSTALFNDGKSCGGCYQMVYYFCPPNYALPNDDGGWWCNPPRPHFDMAQPAFETIAIYRAESSLFSIESNPKQSNTSFQYSYTFLITVCRVGCRRSGGMRFTMNGRDYFELVLISNVGGAGDLSQVWIKGSKSNKWETINGKIKTAIDVVPSYWQFGQSFKSNINF